jgi:hypothetical protein
VFAALQPKVLSEHPMTRVRSAPALAEAAVFDPRLDLIASQVDSAAYFPWIRRLSGAEAVVVDGQNVTFTGRKTPTPMCDLAETYVYERFVAMGYADVAYDPYTFSGVSARNVIATKPGTGHPEQVVIVCGHLDSTSPSSAPTAPGANDNASGTAGVLVAAEVLKDWAFDATIRFVAFTGEEQGLYGSSHYAALVAASDDSVLAVVNMDMIAFWNSERAINIEGKPFCEPIMRVMQDACAEYTSLATHVYFLTCCSDHIPFSQRNMPSLLAIESDYGAYTCYHKECDTWEKNLGGFGSEVARAAIVTAAHIAGIAAAVAVPEIAASPVAFEVMPNPFRESLTIRLPAGVRDVMIHDVTGRRIRMLARDAAASADLAWDGRADSGAPVPAGIYFLRVVEDGRGRATKVVRLPLN